MNFVSEKPPQPKTEKIELEPEVAEILEHVECDIEFKKVVCRLVQEALAEIAEKYGIDGEGKKSFHDKSHTLEAIQDACTAFEKYQESGLNLNERDKLILILAAAYHDLDQDWVPEAREGISILELRRKIEQSAFSSMFLEKDKEVIAAIEFATIFDFAKHQQRIFREPAGKTDFLSRAMALADLAALGKYDRQHWRGNRLFWELNRRKFEQTENNLAAKTQMTKDWLNGQIKFLSKQKVYLEDFFSDDYDKLAVESLYPEIDKNIGLYQKLLAQMEQKEKDGSLNEQYLLEILSVKKSDTERIKQSL